MLSFPEIVARLKAMSLLELERVAYETQLRVTTLRKIRDGQTQDPRLNTVKPLSDWLERNRAVNEWNGRERRKSA